MALVQQKMRIAAIAVLLLCSVAASVHGQQQQCRLGDSLAAELRSQLSPESLVLLPFSAAYRRDIVLRSTNFQSYPQVIVHPAKVKDVVAAVRFAAKNNLTVSVKGTGHDYNGRCSSDGSLNINTRLLNDVFFDVRQNKTFFGAGATFGDIIKPAVLKHGRAVVSGHDLTVGPGGCLLGGCHGALARLHGLGADNVQSVVLVTPTGQLVKASSRGVHQMNTLPNGDLDFKEGKQITSDTSLFWALRGGGGGTLGLVVQFGMQLVPAPTAVQTVTVTWLLYDSQGKQIRDIFDAFVFNASFWQALGPTWAAWSVGSVPRNCSAPQGISSGTASSCAGQAALSFVYVGNDPLAVDKTPGIRAILNYRAPWVSDMTYYTTKTSHRSYYDFMYHNADTSNYQRQFASNVFLSPQDMNPSATGRLFTALETMQRVAAVPLAGPDSFETLGFVVSLVGGGAVPGHPEAAKTSISRAFRSFAAELVLTAGGKDPDWDLRAYQAVSDAILPLYKLYPGSYQNEVSSAEGYNRVPDWQARFWGDNVARLLVVKRQYDPQGRMVVPYGLGWSGQEQ